MKDKVLFSETPKELLQELIFVLIFFGLPLGLIFYELWKEVLLYD